MATKVRIPMQNKKMHKYRKRDELDRQNQIKIMIINDLITNQHLNSMFRLSMAFSEWYVLLSYYCA